MGIALAVVVTSSGFAGAQSAADEYAALMIEVDALNKRASKEQTVDGKLRIIGEAEAKLATFHKKYRDTPESYEAAFQLGALHQNIAAYTQEQERWVKAITYLSEFVVSSGESDRQKMAFAHYYLAESYKGAGKFDEAKHEYRVVLEKFSNVNPKLTQVVEMNIASIDMERRLAVGGEPIDFEVIGINGEKISPADYKGKVLLLDFWATWCGPCKAEIPNVKNVYKKYKSKGFEIVGISLDRSRPALDQYLKQYKMDWPQFYDGKYWNNEIAVQYGVKSIPATFLIDREGKIRYKSLRGKQLEIAVQKLIEEPN